LWTETTPSKKVNETEDSKAGIETLSIAKEEEKVINPVTDKSDPPSSPKVKKQNKLNLQNHLQTTRISYHLFESKKNPTPKKNEEKDIFQGNRFKNKRAKQKSAKQDDKDYELAVLAL